MSGAVCKLVPRDDRLDLYFQAYDQEAAQHEQYDSKEDLDHAYRREVVDFVRWARDEIDDPCLTWREGLHCVQTMQALGQSARANGPWIELPAPPAPKVAANTRQPDGGVPGR